MQLLTAIVLWVSMLAGSSSPTLAQTPQPDEDYLLITQWDLSKPAVEVSVGGSKAKADSKSLYIPVSGKNLTFWKREETSGAWTEWRQVNSTPITINNPGNAYKISFSSGAKIVQIGVNHVDYYFKFTMGSQKDPRLGIEDAVFGDRLRLTAVVSGRAWFGNEDMFLNCENLTSVPLSYRGYHNSIMGTWPIQPRGNLNRMFKGCKSFNQDLSKWLLLDCQDMKEMFAGTAMSPENIDRFLIRLSKVSTKNAGIFNGHKGLKRTGESEEAVKKLRLASWSIDFTLPQDDSYIEYGELPVVATFNPAKLELEPGKAGKAFTVSISPQDMPTTGIKFAIRPANPELKFESGKLVATAACKKGKYSVELDWGWTREVGIEGSMTVIVGKYAPTGVSFTPKSLEITQGQEKSFSYTLQPEGADAEGVTLRIKDAAAGLTLDGTKLKVAVDCVVGDYAVEVIAKDGTTVLGTLPVKVVKPAPSGVTFEPSNLELAPSQEKSFSYTLLPEGAEGEGVTLRIKDAAAGLTLDGSKLKVATDCTEGDYAVEVIAKDGTTVLGTLPVKVAKFAPTGVTFEPSNLELAPSQEKSFSYTLQPEGADAEGVTLRIKDAAASLTLDGTKLKVAADCAVGDYAVEVIAKDGTTVLGTLPVKVAKPAPKPEPLAVENEQLASVLLSPNPATEQIRLSHAEQVAAWQLLSSNGQLEAQGRNQGASEITIPIRALAAGQYLLRLIGPDGDRTLLFIKE